MITRRRVLTLLAAAAGLPLVPRAGHAGSELVRWRGVALGAPASLTLHAADGDAARAAIDAAVAEVARLEAVFSLYRPDSAIAALNRDGVLARPPLDLLDLLTRAREISRLTDGAFDPTIQPLWTLYRDHFSAAGADPAGPDPAAVRRAAALADWRAVEIGDDRIRLGRAGMGLSLNGIAQGCVTDRVTALLRAHGFGRMLVDMGEPRAVGPHPDGGAWRVGIAHPAAPDRIATTIEVTDQAVATSGGYGTLFDPAGRFTHLFDPRDGSTAPAGRGVTVLAAGAATADALSTALAVAPAARRAGIAAAAGVRALLVAADGTVETIGRTI